MIDESHMTMGQIKGMYNGDRLVREMLVNYGFRLPSALDNRPLRREEFESHVHRIVFSNNQVTMKRADRDSDWANHSSDRTSRQRWEVRPTMGQIDDTSRVKSMPVLRKEWTDPLYHFDLEMA